MILSPFFQTMKNMRNVESELVGKAEELNKKIGEEALLTLLRY
jgi:hypothetical protein